MAALLSPVRNRIKVAGMTLRFSPLWALLIVALPLLSGCSTTADEDASPPAATYGCPRAGLMRDADQLAVFEDMANPSRETVTVKSQLYGMTYACTPVPKRGETDVTVTARFVADRMPLGGSLKGLTLPYFIAVLDEQDNILVHKRFSVRLTFGEGAKNLPPTRATAQQEHIIPVAGPDAMAAGTYKIVSGFELIPAQVRYNKGESALIPVPQPPAAPPHQRHKGKK